MTEKNSTAVWELQKPALAVSTGPWNIFNYLTILITTVMKEVNELRSAEHNKYPFFYDSLILRLSDGFGGLVVSMLVPKIAGSNPAEAVGFFRAKNPQYACLRRGSKAAGSISQIFGILKNP
jgi:hypothetical protein